LECGEGGKNPLEKVVRKKTAISGEHKNREEERDAEKIGE